MIMAILNSLSAIIESYLVISIFTNILSIKTLKKEKIFCIILMSFSKLICTYTIPAPFSIFLHFGIIIFLVFAIFKLSILKSISAIVFAHLIFNLVIIFVLKFYMTIFNIDYNQLIAIPVYKFIYLAIIYSIIALVIFIIKIKNFKIDFISDINKENKLLIFRNILFGIIAVFSEIMILTYYYNSWSLFLNILVFICFLFYSILIFYNLKETFNLILITRKLENAETYNKTLHKLHDNVRSFKHDFDNILTTIGGYIDTADIVGLKKYYSELRDDSQKVNDLYVLNPKIINNYGVYTLVTKKYCEADEKGIKFNITFLLDLNTLNMKIYEFTRILGILLDNAIDASYESEEKKINLVFRVDTKNSRQLIIVENTYKDKNIDTEKIFEKGVSGKCSHTGLGLWEVRKIVSKNNNVNLYTSKNNDFFIQQLEIYY